MKTNQIIGLLAAADALPDTWSGQTLGYSDDRDAFGKAVDLLDSLGLISSSYVNSHGEPFEVLRVAGLRIYGPVGFTPNADRQKAPTETLASRTLAPETVLLERTARVLTSGEQPMAYAERVRAGIALSRLLRDIGLTPLAEPLRDDEPSQDTSVVSVLPTRLRAVTQPRGEGA